MQRVEEREIEVETHRLERNAPVRWPLARRNRVSCHEVQLEIPEDQIGAHPEWRRFHSFAQVRIGRQWGKTETISSCRLSRQGRRARRWWCPSTRHPTPAGSHSPPSRRGGGGHAGRQNGGVARGRAWLFRRGSCSGIWFGCCGCHLMDRSGERAVKKRELPAGGE